MRYLLSGGGTGGHVYPVLAVVEALRASAAIPGAAALKAASMQGPNVSQPAGQGDEPLRGAQPASPVASLLATAAARAELAEAMEFRYVGEAGGIEQTLAARAGIPFVPVATGQIRGRAPWVAARNLARMAQGAQKIGRLIAEWHPDAVFVTGGYVAAPVAWAAYRARPRVPLMIYLPDLTPGRAIEATSRLAAKVAVSFPEVARFFGAKSVVTGYPVRADLFTTEKPEAWAQLGLQADLPVLLVFGGSRGARSINRALIEALPDLLPRCQVVHVTGTTDWDAARTSAEATLQATVKAGQLDAEAAARYHAHAYMHDMVHALVAADLVVARAGAATLGEFPAAKLPAVLCPYPFAGQHQDANARFLVERGAAVMIRDAELAAGLKPLLLDLLSHPERLQAMAAAAASLARPDAAANIARELMTLGRAASEARRM